MSTPDHPIINSPFRRPDRHWQLDEQGVPTKVIVNGRRRSEYFVPIAQPRKKSDSQASLDLDQTSAEGVAFTSNDLINEIRGHIERWRSLPPSQWGVTHETARLLDHWREGRLSPPPFFCQVEAVETIIWLEEVAPKHPQFKHLRDKLKAANEDANPDLFRLAAKMATGSGKTTVMAMLIAWQAVNAARGRRNFSDAFLIVTPRHHHPRPAARPLAERSGELLRDARHRPGRHAGRHPQGPHRHHQLPRLQAA